MEEPSIAFARSDREIRVNFGLLTGREVTAAEVEELAKELHPRLESFSIIAEQHFEFGGDVEASVHQVRIELDGRWAGACAADRHVDVVTPYPGALDPVETPS